MDADSGALPRLSRDLSQEIETLRKTNPEFFERPRRQTAIELARESLSFSEPKSVTAWESHLESVRAQGVVESESFRDLNRLASDCREATATSLLRKVATVIPPHPLRDERRHLISRIALENGIDDGRTLEPSAAAELVGISGVTFDSWPIETQIVMLKAKIGAKLVVWSKWLNNSEAAKLLGCDDSKKAAWLNRKIEKGVYRVERDGRQKIRFDMATIPAELHAKFALA
jgi:hypothetical protein